MLNRTIENLEIVGKYGFPIVGKSYSVRSVKGITTEYISGDGFPEVIVRRDPFGDEWVLEYEPTTEVVRCQLIGSWF